MLNESGVTFPRTVSQHPAVNLEGIAIGKHNSKSVVHLNRLNHVRGSRDIKHGLDKTWLFGIAIKVLSHGVSHSRDVHGLDPINVSSFKAILPRILLKLVKTISKSVLKRTHTSRVRQGHNRGLKDLLAEEVAKRTSSLKSSTSVWLVLEHSSFEELPVRITSFSQSFKANL